MAVYTAGFSGLECDFGFVMDRVLDFIQATHPEHRLVYRADSDGQVIALVDLNEDSNPVHEFAFPSSVVGHSIRDRLDRGGMIIAIN